SSFPEFKTSLRIKKTFPAKAKWVPRRYANSTAGTKPRVSSICFVVSIRFSKGRPPNLFLCFNSILSTLELRPGISGATSDALQEIRIGGIFLEGFKKALARIEGIEVAQIGTDFMRGGELIGGEKLLLLSRARGGNIDGGKDTLLGEAAGEHEFQVSR